MGGILILILFSGMMIENTMADIRFSKRRVQNIWKADTKVPFSKANGLHFTVSDQLYERACREGMNQEKVFFKPRPAYDDIATYNVLNFYEKAPRNINLVRCSGFPSTFYLRKMDKETYAVYWQRSSQPPPESSSRSSRQGSSNRTFVQTWQSNTVQQMNPYRT